MTPRGEACSGQRAGHRAVVEVAMVSILLSWLAIALALLLADRLFDGVQLRGDLGVALMVALGFSVLNFFFHWVFFILLGFATLGIGFLFYFATQLVSTALVLKLTSALSRRFMVRGFGAALGTAVLVTLAGALVEQVF